MSNPSTHERNIKVPRVNGGRFPLEYDAQKYVVMRMVTPEDADDVSIGQRWGSSRVGIQVLGAFPTRNDANAYACGLKDVEDWADYYVVDMYEWLELPPRGGVPETTDEEGIQVERKQPLLQEFMAGTQAKKSEEAELMKMRIEMATGGTEGANDIKTKEHAKWSREQRMQQLDGIIGSPPGTYPEIMVKASKQRRATHIINSPPGEYSEDMVDDAKQLLAQIKADEAQPAAEKTLADRIGDSIENP